MHKLHLYQSAATQREYTSSVAKDLDKDSSPFGDDRRFSMNIAIGKSSSRSRIGFYQQNMIGSTNSTSKPVTVMSSIQIKRRLLTEMSEYEEPKKELPALSNED